jgi:hypothetical protein
MTNPVSSAGRVLVSPRHLAGSGLDRLDDALDPLIKLFGWQHQQHPSDGSIALSSPCHTLFIDIHRTDQSYWRISHHDPFWQIDCSRETPIEAITAMLGVLPQFLGERRHAQRFSVTQRAFPRIAQDSGWAMTADGDTTTFRSADGRCSLRHVPEAEIRWTARLTLTDSEPHWHASFTRAVPTRLVAQFFSHLASPDPVERTFTDLPGLVASGGIAVIAPLPATAGTPAPSPAADPAARARPTRRR